MQSGSNVTTVDGAISLTGNSVGDGVVIEGDSSITSTGADTGTITITGTSTGTAGDDGVVIQDAASTVSSAEGNITITGTGNGGVELVAGVTLAVQATGGADITIIGTSTGAVAGVQMDSPISSNTGTVDILSNDDVTFGADGDVNSVSGNVTVGADLAVGNNGGVVTMADGALIDGGSGDVDLEADGNVTVGGVLTTGNVLIDSISASVVDGGDAHKDVSAATAVITAAVDVGDLANALDTQLANLEATATTGGIWIDNMGALSVGGISAVIGMSAAGNINLTNDLDVTITELITTPTGGVTITSTAGSILDAANTATDITAASAVLSAANDVGTAGDFLETQLGNLEAVATTGGVWLSNTGALTVGGIGAMVGVSGNGDVNLVNDVDITIDELISSTTGMVTVESTGGAIADGNGTDVNVMAGWATLLADTGISTDTSVSFIASNNATSGNIDISNSGAGLLTIDTIGATTGVVNGGGDTTVTTDGSLTVAQQATATGALALSTSSVGGATITVTGNVSGGTSATITGGSGNDLILVSSTANTVDNLLSAVTVDGGGGTGDVLTLGRFRR